MRKLLCAFFFLLCGSTSFAQSKTTAAFDSYNAVGFLAGKSPLAFTAQSVNGIRLDKWFVGAGFGIDDYFISSLPFFVDVRRELFSKKFCLFVYGDAGTHFTSKDKSNTGGFTSIHTKGKLYLDAGLGLKLDAGKNNHGFLTVGNTLKNVERTEFSPELSMPYKYSSLYKLSRLSVKIGFQF
jgi:hypothetical protein